MFLARSVDTLVNVCLFHGDRMTFRACWLSGAVWCASNVGAAVLLPDECHADESWLDFRPAASVLLFSQKTQSDVWVRKEK